MQAAQQNSGFTLVELMVTIAVLAILVAIGIPSFQSTLDKRRLTGAAEQLYADLQYARSEAIKRNANVLVSLKPAKDVTSATWCYGISTATCDCSTGTTCQLDGVTKIVNQDGFRGVTLMHNFTGDRLTLNSQRGTATQGTISLSASVGTVQVIVSSLGRMRICSDDVPDYKPSSGSC